MTWRENIELVAGIVAALVLMGVFVFPNIRIFVMCIYAVVEAYIHGCRGNRNSGNDRRVDHQS